jgi:molybdopterin-guanine dinucleotide biosynthesis protein A
MILGALLAGGRSSRFGSDKALAPWEGRPLIAHVADRLRTICAAVVVCGRDYGLSLAIPDRPAPDLGPLGGLNAALHHAAAHGFDVVITAPCDAPALSDELLAALAEIPNRFVGALPVIGCWRSADAALLDRFLAEGGSRSMRSWAEKVGAIALDLPAPVNVNRPGDLDRLGSA